MCCGTLLYLQFSNDVWKWWAFFFICPFTICVSSLVMGLSKCFAHFLIKLFSYSWVTLYFLKHFSHCYSDTMFSSFLPASWCAFSVFSTILLFLCSSFKSFPLYTSFLSHLTYCHDFRNCCDVQSPINAQLTLWARPLFQDGREVWPSNLLYSVFPILMSDISIQLRQKLALMSPLPLSPLP